jgi:hypothetical protein
VGTDGESLPTGVTVGDLRRFRAEEERARAILAGWIGHPAVPEILEQAVPRAAAAVAPVRRHLADQVEAIGLSWFTVGIAAVLPGWRMASHTWQLSPQERAVMPAVKAALRTVVDAAADELADAVWGARTVPPALTWPFRRPCAAPHHVQAPVGVHRPLFWLRGSHPGSAGVPSCWDSIATSARLAAMTFGKQSGPPASARQVQELLTLLQEAGHAGFRDARGPMGFTQRQAGGKFTRDEVAAFIDRLQDAEFDRSAPVAAPTARQPAAGQALRDMPVEQLAAELQRRGWIVTKP